MYGLSIPDPNDSASTGAVPLDPEDGYNHLGEVGRALRGSGSRMFDEFSRCWKCWFMHHYRIPRPGDPNNDGLEPEEPKQTRWACNNALDCAEDLCHVRCWKVKIGGSGEDLDQEFAFVPYPT